MLHRTPLQAAEALHLPANWTQLDQEIMMALLFDQPVGGVRDEETNAQHLLRYRSLLARQIANETRKSKHRAVQRRFIQRKKDQISRVKEQAYRLEKEVVLLQITREKKQLQTEQDSLLEDVNKREPLPFPTQDHIGLLLSDQQNLIRDSYVPLTGDDWNALLRKNLLEFNVSSCETDYESTGAVVMGWSDRRKIDFEKGTTRFVMSKRFAYLNVQDFYETTFEKLCKPETHPKLFHPAVTMKMQHLQKINDDGVVMHRCMFNPQTGEIVHSIETMMRVQRGRDNLIFLRTPDHNAAYECLPASHRWMKLFTALVFTPSMSSSARRVTGGEEGREPGCIFRYAGCLWDLPPPDVKYWILEMLYVILRFESVMVAPVFALRTENSAELASAPSSQDGSTTNRDLSPPPMESTSALPATIDLPACWTPTDQRIMEQLLLDKSDVEDHHKADHQDAICSPRTVELNRTAQEKKLKLKMKPQPTATATRRSVSPPKELDSDKAKQVEEDRRARHRAVQRRFIQRKKAEVERTKVLAQALESKYRYLELSVEERDLKAENRELQHRVGAAAAAVPRVPNVDPVQLLMQNEMELVKEFYEPLTPQVLASVQHNAQQEYELSRRDDAFQTSGACVMGWSDYRKVEKSSLKFVLTKGFPNVRALHLMNFTWDTLSSPATYARFFSPAFPIKMQVLQVINRDAVVLHRVLFNPHTQSSSNSLELLWRVRLGDEYVIFDSVLQHNAVQQCLGESYKWTQMTTSLGFSPLDAHRDSGCILRHGGWIRTMITNVNYWFMEMFFMALRFESTMVAPVFALPSKE